jgi:predicted transcriptional regulator
MSNDPVPLFELEAEVMDLIWQASQATVREVLDGLNARSARPRAYTTVLTTMQRLDRKGLLTRRREGRSDVYLPALTREQYTEARAQAEVGGVIDQFGDAALVHFARQLAALDPERREQLRRLAEDA